MNGGRRSRKDYDKLVQQPGGQKKYCNAVTVALKGIAIVLLVWRILCQAFRSESFLPDSLSIMLGAMYAEGTRERRNKCPGWWNS
jgi:hypothetical protein